MTFVEWILAILVIETLVLVVIVIMLGIAILQILFADTSEPETQQDDV